jgi:hypothetical protein
LPQQDLLTAFKGPVQGFCVAAVYVRVPTKT